jgi:hypothetical protein
MLNFVPFYCKIIYNVSFESYNMDRTTRNYINSGNAAYIDSLYEAYKQDPESVDFGWQKFFEGFDFGKESQPAKAAPTRQADTPEHFLKEINVMNMIDGYRHARPPVSPKPTPCASAASISRVKSWKPLD